LLRSSSPSLMNFIVCALLVLGLVSAQQQYSGYIPVNAKHNAELFYWWFPSMRNPANDPLLLWLTGGPGCSSELALAFENGPFQIDSNGKKTNNPYSWNTYANLLYVDQPAGTGFSVCDEDYVTDEKQVVADMLNFFVGFYNKFPQLLNNSLVIVGESYAGHYVPAIAAGIITYNSNANRNLTIPLTSIGVGNGWVDPATQYGSYGPFAFGVNLIDANMYTQMNQTYAQCFAYIQQQDWDDADGVCSQLLEDVLEEAGNINIYNYKLPCVGSLCYDFTAITNYFNDPQVQKALGVKSGITWETCNDEINEMFTVDRIESFKFDIPTILAAQIPVTIYNGQLDVICNWVGGYMWTQNMQWPYQNQYAPLPLTDWTYNGQVVGQMKAGYNLTFIAPLNAGHMVPHDVPDVALALLGFISPELKGSKQ